MPSPSYPSSLFGYTNGVRRGIQLIIQICVFCTTRNNFLPNQDKYRRATRCRLCATVYSTHFHPPSVSKARLPAQPKDLSFCCTTRKHRTWNGVTSAVLHIRVYFSSNVNSNIRPNCFTVNRIPVSSYRRAGTNDVSTVKQSGSL